MKSDVTRPRATPPSQRKVMVSRWPSDISTLDLPNIWNCLQGALFHLNQNEPATQEAIACLKAAQKTLAKLRNTP